MSIKNEQDILHLIQEDKWMMDVLTTAQSLHLPDWWVCAGFVRSKIWDTLHGFTDRTSTPDVDVIYFDPTNIEESIEKQYEEQLHTLLPGIPWSVKNEARMHLVNGLPPYTSSVDAISQFPETATALGVTLDDSNTLHLSAPHGIKDTLHFIIRPTPTFLADPALLAHYEKRLIQKNWQAKWPKVRPL
ncbi:nucleotidyltransferase family protein [Priestia taiwanensis]|uniref:Nucleotidyltransferase family protein n=1 Tax=Priestia taiwanensis TaxID=1347902 RepID=A0A917AJB6_9BACI|nr:nucleotidyltransferase family protein [Priestia taiwanensis]MBM7361816.1 hypothetical protein [Priestia taiwanensis]GGE57188.1 hypothetical protein GCM10007140_04410 [Priestia taiwanensis]